MVEYLILQPFLMGRSRQQQHAMGWSSLDAQAPDWVRRIYLSRSAEPTATRSTASTKRDIITRLLRSHGTIFQSALREGRWKHTQEWFPCSLWAQSRENREKIAFCLINANQMFSLSCAADVCCCISERFIHMFHSNCSSSFEGRGETK